MKMENGKSNFGIHVKLFLLITLNVVLFSFIWYNRIDSTNVFSEIMDMIKMYGYNTVSAVFHIILANYAYVRVKMYRQKITNIELNDQILPYVAAFVCVPVFTYESRDALLIKILLTFATMILIKWAGVVHSNIEAEDRIKKIKFPVGSNLAEAMFRWLENVIKGKHNKAGVRMSPPFQEAFQEYKIDNHLLK